MTPDQIAALAQFPIIGILIFVIVRQDSRIDKLMQTLQDMTAKNTADLLSLVEKQAPVPLQLPEVKE
jgi:hypothetical protein